MRVMLNSILSIVEKNVEVASIGTPESRRPPSYSV